MNAIQTAYNGYMFRSRLEARWAVFFDAAGIPYIYEPEGIQFKDGERYLPDFYLPWFNAYVEIKPQTIEFEEEKNAIKKCEKLFSECDNCVVLYCKGDPVECEMKIHCFYADEGGGGQGWFFCQFVEGAKYSVYETDENGDEIVCQAETSKHYICLACGERYDRTREYQTSNCKTKNTIPYCDIFAERSWLETEKIAGRSASFEYDKKIKDATGARHLRQKILEEKYPLHIKEIKLYSSI